MTSWQLSDLLQAAVPLGMPVPQAIGVAHFDKAPQRGVESVLAKPVHAVLGTRLADAAKVASRGPVVGENGPWVAFCWQRF
jgi:hypothetical protein